MAQKATDDGSPLTREQKVDMIETFRAWEGEYRDEQSDMPTVIEETERYIVAADDNRVDLSEWENHFGIEGDELQSHFREIANEVLGDERSNKVFSYKWPVVFDKLDN